MNQSNLDESGKQFLLKLFEASNGDVSTKVSMYEIGEALGMDRSQANFITTELVGFDYVEIRTLSGAIGITEQGLDAAGNLGAEGGKQKEKTLRLGTGPILDGVGKNACDTMVAKIKSRATKLGLDFDVMAEMMADLKTIDAQLSSPKPKTVIIRESFRSVQSILKTGGDKEIAGSIQELIG
jgi:septum formation inhibitor MinC